MTDTQPTEQDLEDAALDALLRRAADDVFLAAAIESAIGGTPTGSLEEADEALLRSYVAVHGVAHLDEAATRHAAHLAEVDRVNRATAKADAEAFAREQAEAQRLSRQAEEREQEERERLRRLAEADREENPKAKKGAKK